MDKCREEFESKWADVMKGDDDTGRIPTRSAINPDEYAGGAAQFAWKWFKYSRESMRAIKLPQYKNSNCFTARRHNQTVDEIKKQITSAGYEVEE